MNSKKRKLDEGGKEMKVTYQQRAVGSKTNIPFQEEADRIQHIKMFLCLQSFTKISKFQILYKLKRMGRTCNYLRCKARFLLWISVEL